jgi:hypothetical protein
MRRQVWSAAATIRARDSTSSAYSWALSSGTVSRPAISLTAGRTPTPLPPRRLRLRDVAILDPLLRRCPRPGRTPARWAGPAAWTASRSRPMRISCTPTAAIPTAASTLVRMDVPSGLLRVVGRPPRSPQGNRPGPAKNSRHLTTPRAGQRSWSARVRAAARGQVRAVCGPAVSMTIVSRAAPVAFVAERSRRPRAEHPDPPA